MKKEKLIPFVMSGWITLITSLVLFGYFARYGYELFISPDPVGWFAMGKAAILGLILPIVICGGNITLKPNEAVVCTFVGNYIGTLRKTGYYWIPSWLDQYSLRNLASNRIAVKELKVNDKNGNPIVIACEIYYREDDTYMATFDVSNLDKYLKSKGEVALRTLAMNHVMDSADDGEVSLRGNAEKITQELIKEISAQFAVAGQVVEGAGITNLNYAPEIAAMMLQRQQAQSMIDARATMAKGAVGIIKDTLAQLKDEQVIDEFDQKGKQRLVSNLLVTLCSSHPVTPVLEVQSSASDD
ncbi:MAG: SPFH domain-containing protein [Candidatus Paceibacterota bacterium]